ncbi:LOW QUALITY PROTEIN: olfactory receptor 5V1-like [Dasypus novemcinctus]|uniref:LOW QUALITY PROTEIN: olfactory receptor 5V1-like n=1 Tax=Dasypus novemcinctus TaxID=9361 RepID=UPI00265F0FC0|nr:LOW QUALITY PROTEIN: olfactory receptor 5V1-like [Dasypus novemcinctus]
MGDISIITVIIKDHQIYTPMYFFLKNLSFLDMRYTPVTMPKAIVNAILGSKDISFTECMAQLYLFFTMAANALAYDNCMAIYRPLFYGVIMTRNLYWEPVSTSWIFGALCYIFHAVNTFSLPFCGPNVIDHFFCDIPPVMRLSCADYQVNEELIFIYSSCIILGAFGLTVVFHICIISTIIQTNHVQGHWKAFSTCSSYLANGLLFYGTGISMYLRPISNYFPIRGRLAVIFYSIITPTLNPVIYCMKNTEMNAALKKMCHQIQRKN